MVHCYSGKEINITHSECMSVTLGIQRSMHMRRIILSSVACLPQQYRVIQKDGLNFIRLYSLNYTWYVNDLHNI